MGSVTYYVHHTGKVAVSLDNGDTIFLPAGRRVERDPVWRETNDDLYEQLTPEQRVVVDPVQEAELRGREAHDALRHLADDFNRERDARRPRPLGSS